MTRVDYQIYLLLKKLDEEKAHDFLINFRKRERESTVETEYIRKTILASDNYGSWIEKYAYPYDFTQEEIDLYLEEHWISAYPSLYDCTGQMFTRDIKIFVINGKTMVYHFKALDV